ncbi:hypothetical protein X975_01415, partial [Stegodyphus mimosarum]
MHLGIHGKFSVAKIVISAKTQLLYVAKKHEILKERQLAWDECSVQSSETEEVRSSKEAVKVNVVKGSRVVSTSDRLYKRS